jgi:hypothetical protein
MRAPTPLPAGRTGAAEAVEAVALVPIAPWSAEAKLVPEVEVELVGVDCGGAKAESSAWIRVRTDSRLTAS